MSDEEMKKVGTVVHILINDFVIIHPLFQGIEIGLLPDFDTNQGRTSFPAVFLGIFKMGNIVGRTQNMLEKLSQLSGGNVQ